MSLQTINIGAAPNDGTGDPIRTGGQKINSNFEILNARFAEVFYDALEEGLVGDNTADDSAALNTLLTAIGADAKNAVIHFPNTGTPYKFSGALLDGSGANAQIVIPQRAITDAQYTIEFIGDGPPSRSGSGATAHPLPRGTILKSVTPGTVSGTRPSFIAGIGPVGGAFDRTNFLRVNFRNLIIQLPANPTYSGINCDVMTDANFFDVSVFAGATMTTVDITEPTTATSYGIYMQRLNVSALAQLRSVNVFGFYTGIKFGELVNADDIGIWSCKIAAEFDANYHPVCIDRLLCFWCPTNLKFTGAAWVNIRDLFFEKYNVAGQWYSPAVDISDPTSIARGEIIWHEVTAGAGVTHTISLDGADNLRIRDLGSDYGASGGAPSGAIVWDSFTGANTTPLLSHTADTGQSWAQIEGVTDNLTLNNGKLQSYPNGAAAYAYVIDSTDAGVTITADFIFGVFDNVHYCEIIFRCSDASNLWKAQVLGPAGNNIKLIKTVATVETVVDQDTVTLVAGQQYRFEVVTSGNGITFTVNGVVLTGTDAFNNTATKHGIRMYQASGAVSTVDHFAVVP